MLHATIELDDPDPDRSHRSKKSISSNRGGLTNMDFGADELPEAGSLGRRGGARGIVRPSNHGDRIDAIFGALGGTSLGGDTEGEEAVITLIPVVQLTRRLRSLFTDWIPSWFRVSGNRKPMRLWTQRSIQRIQMVKASPASVLRPNRKIETVEPFAKYEYTIQKRIHYKYYIISLFCCYTEMNSKRRVFCRTLFSCFLLIFLYFMGCVHSPTPCYGMCLLALSVPRRR